MRETVQRQACSDGEDGEDVRSRAAMVVTRNEIRGSP